jgi:hypothetical protein
MFADAMVPELISRFTGLSVERIEALQNRPE